MTQPKPTPEPPASRTEAPAGPPAQAPRLPGTALPRSAGLLLVLGAILLLETVQLLGVTVPTPAAILLLVVAYATYLDGRRTGIAAAVVAVTYEIYNVVWRGMLQRETAGPLSHTLTLAALTFLTVWLIVRFRARLDELLRSERLLLGEAESKRRELATAFARVERAQEAIRFQARLLDAIGQALIATDAHGRIVYWNGPASALFRIRAREAAHRLITEIMPDPPNTQETTLDRLRRGASWSGETEVRTDDGTPVAVLYSDSPIRDDDGLTIGLVRIAADVTARKNVERTQRLLADAGSALASALDQESAIRNLARLCVPVFADRCIVHVQREDGTIRKVQAGHIDVPGRGFAERTAAAGTGDESERAVQDVIRSGLMRFFPVILPFANTGVETGQGRPAGAGSAIIAPMRAGGRTLGALSFHRSSSQPAYEENDLLLAEELANRAAGAIHQARLLEQALVASKAKSDFLAVMSHELRTPLTTVTGYTDLMLSSVPEPLPPRYRAYVDRIRLAATHLLSLIEQILVYARLEAGRDRTHPERVHVADVLGDAAALIEPVARERGIRFRVSPPEAPTTIETDATRLRQILLNLLANAVKFTDEGEVSLSAAAVGPDITFTVRDTGIGISPSDLAHVFDPFWQVDQSSTRRAGGAGLGLSVSRRLAQMLGGDITVDSRPGEGTTFALRLPARWTGPVPDSIGLDVSAII